MPHGSGITLARPWGALSQAEALRLATNPRTGPLHVRVFFAAIGRANTIGHAPFDPTELAQLLAGRNGRPAHRTHLANAIRRAVAAGLLLADSGSRCLRPAPALWDRAGGHGSRTCAWHATRRGSDPAAPALDPRLHPEPGEHHPTDPRASIPARDH